VNYTLDGETTTFSFHDPTDRYVVTCKAPPASSLEDTVPEKTTFIFAPKPHWHRTQVEEFHLVKGAANFTIEDEAIHVKEGGVITIQPGQYHTFCNASTEEEMEIEFVLEPETRLRDENYFSELFLIAQLCLSMLCTIEGLIFDLQANGWFFLHRKLPDLPL
jgi:mannose-6-phosphate isomerase-like protein (cupin superfamily)